MKPAELDSVLDSVESIHRIAEALARDTGKIAELLKVIQRRPAAPSEKADIYAYNSQLLRTLPHYGIAANVRESLHETLLSQYAELHGFDTAIVVQCMSGRKAGAEVIMDAAAAVAVDDGPTPTTPLQDSLLALTDSLSRRNNVPRPLGVLVAEHFSPAVLLGGRGFLRPGQPPELGSFSEDMLVVGPVRAAKWPAGWYKHESVSSAPDQFYLKLDNFAILIIELRSGTPSAMVVKLADSSATEWMSVRDLTRSEDLVLSAEAEKYFNAMSAPA